MYTLYFCLYCFSLTGSIHLSTEYRPEVPRLNKVEKFSCGSSLKSSYREGGGALFTWMHRERTKAGDTAALWVTLSEYKENILH